MHHFVVIPVLGPWPGGEDLTLWWLPEPEKYKANPNWPLAFIYRIAL